MGLVGPFSLTPWRTRTNKHRTTVITIMENSSAVSSLHNPLYRGGGVEKPRSQFTASSGQHEPYDHAKEEYFTN